MDIKPQINLSPTTTLNPSLIKLHSILLFPLVGFAIGSLISLIILFIEEVIIEHNVIFEGTDLDHVLLPVGCGILGAVFGFFYGKWTHQRKSAIQDLYISQQTLNLILDSMPQMILYIDADLNIRYTNKTFEKWIGIAPGEICGEKLENVAPKVIYNKIRLVLAENGNDELINFESSVEIGEKERHSITTMIPHLATNQKLEGYFTVVTDVTMLRKRENKIKKQKDELAELNATKDKFFSIISHDLKNPFNSLLGFSELLRNEYSILDEATRKEFVGYIYEGVQNAYKLLNNLLAWSRAQSGKIEFNPSLVNLKDLVDENLQLLLHEADMKSIHLQADISNNFLVYTDPDLVGTVIRNLLTNAIKFTPKEGRVTISANLVLENQAGEYLEIAIEDTGLGIPPENLEKLFKVGKSISTSGTEGESGTGLGLMICKEFIEKCGGKIWVESEVGKGSVFYFTLPNNYQLKNNIIDKIGE